MNKDLLSVRVVDRRAEANGIVAFELASVDARELPPFSAGSHIDVHIACGTIRQYSLFNDSRERHRYRIAVLREEGGRGGSRALHDRIQVGQVLDISQPRNAFSLDPSAPHSLLFAGGIGITPILAMAEELLAESKPFALHYCCRSQDRAAFLDRLAQADIAEHVHLHFDEAGADQKLELAAVLAAAPQGSHLYVCGPTGFMDFVIGQAKAALPEKAIHREYFAAPVPAAGAAGNGEFQVRLVRSGRTLDVPADQSIAKVLTDNGVEVSLSCEQGICGTCMVSVVAGTPDHRDMYLTQAEHAENKRMTICCSRSKTPVLELDL